MPMIDIKLNGDGAWPELQDVPAEKIFRTSAVKLCALEHGMEGGRPSVCVRVDCPDGRVVLWETSVAQFLQAAAALRGRWPDQG